MPIYIVRWNNPVPAVCLVKAANKRVAVRLMDDIHGDPNYCEIKEYKGFLVVNIDLPIKYHEESVGNSIVPHITIEDTSQCLDDPKMDVTLDAETVNDILEAAFPHYDNYWSQRINDLGKPNELRDEKTVAEECKKAIQQDFDDMENKIRAKLGYETKDVLEQAEDILYNTEDNM